MTDNSSAMPLYHQVASILHQRIKDAIYPIGSQILPEDDLAAEFGVSRTTIRQAIGLLASQGLLVRHQGRGTFVEADDRNLSRRFRGSLGDLSREAHRTKTREILIDHHQRFPDYIASALNLSEPTGTIVRRTRTFDGQPFAYSENYLPDAYGQQLSIGAVQDKAVMQALVDMGLALQSASQSIRAELGDVYICSKIDVEIGSAILHVERLVSDAEGEPVELVRSWYRGDRYEYMVTLDLDAGSVPRAYVHLA